MHIRPATPADLKGALAVYKSARASMCKSGNPNQWGDSFPPRELVEQDISTGALRVCVDENDEVLGYIFCILIDHSVDSARCPNKELYIDDLCVDEKCRHEGIGDALFKKALETAKELGCHDLTLNVWEGNDSALRFYEKHGMKIQKREMEIVLD